MFHRPTSPAHSRFGAQEAVYGTGAAEATANASAPSVAADSVLVSTLLAVVSELTGYPVEMLGLDMDIEADLGIDSIKRVEILSTLEERSPGLPAIAPEDMGRLKTLASDHRFFRRRAARSETLGRLRTRCRHRAA